MSKYIIEIDDNDTLTINEHINLKEEHNMDGVVLVATFDGYPITKIENSVSDTLMNMGIEIGTEKAWEFCRFLYCKCNYRKIYGMELYDILKMGYHNAKAKYDKWLKQEEDKKIKVGDEVVYYEDNSPTLIVTNVSDNYFDGINQDGVTYSSRDIKWFKKTGKHYPEVVELLRKIKVAQDDSK